MLQDGSKSRTCDIAETQYRGLREGFSGNIRMKIRKNEKYETIRRQMD
jgi:hypothetical protein